jgi:hypothetical protein
MHGLNYCMQILQTGVFRPNCPDSNLCRNKDNVQGLGFDVLSNYPSVDGRQYSISDLSSYSNIVMIKKCL